MPSKKSCYERAVDVAMKFVVKETDVGGPVFLVAEPYGESPAEIALWLRPGFDYEDAQALAERLNAAVRVVRFAASWDDDE